jgi:ribonuclease HI
MSAPEPHFLLYSASAPTDPDGKPGDWRFVLESVDGTSKLEIVDTEPNVRGERLELLAVVRGLEAIDEPARVTLVTPSRYVSRGISYGLTDWRENDWQWERHGEMVPVKDRDLWQRVDRALEFHRVECRQWRLDGPHDQSRSVPSCAGGADQPLLAGSLANRSTRFVAYNRFASEPANERIPLLGGAKRRLQRIPAILAAIWHRLRQKTVLNLRTPRLD